MFAYAELIAELDYKTAVAAKNKLVVGDRQLLVFDLENLNRKPLDLSGRIEGFVTNIAKCPNGSAVIETSCGIDVYCLYYVYPDEGEVQKICQIETEPDMVFHILTCSGNGPERDVMVVLQDLGSEKTKALVPEKEKMREISVDINKAYNEFATLKRSSQKEVRIGMNPYASRSILWWMETENGETVPAAAFTYEKNEERFSILFFYDRNQDKAVGILPVPYEYLNRLVEEETGNYVSLDVYAGEGALFVWYSHRFDLLVDRVNVAKKEAIAYKTKILNDITSTVVPLKPSPRSQTLYGLANSSGTLKLLLLRKEADGAARGFTSGAVYDNKYSTILYMMKTASIGDGHIVISSSGIEDKKTFIWRLKKNYLVYKQI